MGKDDHYVFMDGCVVKGCRTLIEFERTFGEYADLLEDLFHRGGWGRGEKRVLGVRVGGRKFEDWATEHIYAAQSTQNKRTGASRVDEVLRSIEGNGNIHLFGTSAAGAAILEYVLLTDPGTLYYRPHDPRKEFMPAKRYDIDPRIASLTTIDAPTNWVPVRRDPGWPRPGWSKGTIGYYLAKHTRIKAGPKVPKGAHTNRTEDVPGTWVGAEPVAGLDYDNDPHYDYLPRQAVERHMYTGGHMSHETRDFLRRVWR